MSPKQAIAAVVLSRYEGGECYVIPAGGKPDDARDKYLEGFPDSGTALAYCQEVNDQRKQDELQGTYQSGQEENTSDQVQPSQAYRPGGDDPQGRYSAGQATPSAQLGGESPGPSITFPPSYSVGTELFRGMPLDQINDHIAAVVDNAGIAFESLGSVLTSRNGLVNGNARQLLGSIAAAVTAKTTPILQGARDAVQLIKDTATLYVQNTLGSAITAAGSIAADSGIATISQPVQQSADYIVFSYAGAAGGTCAGFQEKNAPLAQGYTYLAGPYTLDQAQSIADAYNTQNCHASTTTPPQVPPPIGTPPPVPPISTTPPPIPPVGPPQLGPDCCPIPTCPGFVKSPPNTYYAVNRQDGTHDDIQLTTPPAVIIWLPYGAYYQLPCYVPRNLETDLDGLACLSLAGYDKCHPGRKVAQLWRPNNSIECTFIDTIPMRGILDEQRLVEIRGRIFFGEFYDPQSSAYLNDYVVYQVCPRSPIPTIGKAPGTTPATTPTTSPPSTPPSTPTVPAPSLPTITLPGGSGLSICDRIESVSQAFSAIGAALSSKTGIDIDTIGEWTGKLGNFDAKVKDQFTEIVKQVRTAGTLYDFMNSVRSIVEAYNKDTSGDYYNLLAVRILFDALESIDAKATSNIDQKAEDVASLAPSIFGIGFGHNWTDDVAIAGSVDISVRLIVVPLRPLLDQCINWSMPQNLPSIQDALRLHLTNDIDEDHCRCLVELNGGVWSEHKLLINSQRSRVDGFQTVQLWMRGFIDTAELRAKLRELGFIEEAEQDELIALAKWIPGPTDLVRFMVRDVEDPQVVLDYDLDAEFTDKFTGQLEQFATGQGVDRETMLRYWRAHWQFPSPGQLYEMLHRLRPDNIPAGVQPSDWIVNEDDVARTLAVNDISPVWRDKLVAISYRPLTRVDARRAFNVGKLDRPGLIANLRDQGYALAKAEILADFFEVLRLQSFRTNVHVKSYVSGGINESDLREILSKDIKDNTLIDQIVEEAKDRASINAKQRCINALRTRILAGEFNFQDAVARLLDLGVDNDQAVFFASSWGCERDAKAKHINAGSLCKYFEDGLITVDDFSARLLRFGYDANDAIAIINECGIRINERRQKAAEALARKTQAEQEKIQKEREKIANAIKKAKDDEIKARERIAKAQRSMQDRFTKAAARYARIRGIDTADASADMESAAIHGHSNFGLSNEEATELSIELASAWKAKEDHSFIVEYDKMAQARLDAINAITS